MAAAALVLLGMPGGGPATARAETAAEAAVREVIEAEGQRCGVRFDGFSLPDLKGGELPTTIFADVAAANGWRGGSTWQVEEGLEVLPWSPGAGEILRGCSGRGGKPTTASDWMSLPYFDGNDVELGTSERWRGARQLQGTFSPFEEGGWPIWERKCKRKPQKVSFKRGFHVPGPAESRPFVVVDDHLVPDSSRRAVKWVKVWINNRRIGKLRFGREQAGPGAKRFKRRLLEYGRNKMELKAKKRRTGRCNRSGSGAGAAAPTTLGFSAELNADFVADLAVTNVPLVAPGSGSTYENTLVVENVGRSGAFAGELELDFRVSSASTFRTVVNEVTPPASCEPAEITDPSPGSVERYEILCELEDLEPGEVAEVSLASRPLTGDDGRASMRLEWEGKTVGIGDANLDNGQGAVDVSFCDAAIVPDCPGAG